MRQGRYNIRILLTAYFLDMEDPFVLEVDHNGKKIELETRFIRLGYTWKFSVMIDETEVLFERDESGSFRAVIPEGIYEKKGSMDVSLLQKIAGMLESALS
jgi:hypothetical protein